MGYSPKKIVPRMEIYEDDGPWMWVAFAPGCRLIIDFIIGPRKQFVADKLLESAAIPVLNKITCKRWLNILIFRNNFIALSIFTEYES